MRSDEGRSRIMSSIKSRDTTPELLVRKAIWAKGYRYRVNCKRLPGKPDLLFAKHKIAIFVHGCFWHHHFCQLNRYPKRNVVFWREKLDTNVKRDTANISKLKSLGYRVIVLWECEIDKDLDGLLQRKVFKLLSLHHIQSSPYGDANRVAD